MKGSTDSLLDFFKKIVSILNLICKICSIIKNKKKIEIANLGQYNTRIQWILYTSQILENLSSNIHRQKHPHVTISHLQSLSRHALFKTLTHLSPIFSLPHFPASQTHPLLKHQTLTPHHPHPLSVSKYLLFSLPIQTQWNPPPFQDLLPQKREEITSPIFTDTWNLVRLLNSGIPRSAR